ncbi:DUF742 domain-containing protein [Saccharopolyspora sp. K220]|uniref:DUF742 domain-containing protein n=1 Tax=Saccharopolyspora soli TaxID=2926618 RepID=UPI001F5AE48D|nr:DUF742 domain-containing protein [Saccharopolyspora soli]MCI2422904.1 DUF742 domain-containing protein [Saccharopolyspora soli]
MTPAPREGPLVGSWAVTDGHTSLRADLDPSTLVTAATSSVHDLRDERRRVAEHCQGGVLGIADIAGAVGLSVLVTLVLVSQLLDSGHLRVQVPAEAPSMAVLEEVLRGLRRLELAS